MTTKREGPKRGPFFHFHISRRWQSRATLAGVLLLAGLAASELWKSNPPERETMQILLNNHPVDVMAASREGDAVTLIYRAPDNGRQYTLELDLADFGGAPAEGEPPPPPAPPPWPGDA